MSLSSCRKSAATSARATDQASRGIYAATAAAGDYAIASSTDQNSLAPKTVLGIGIAPSSWTP
jgi:hypothetical protein